MIWFEPVTKARKLCPAARNTVMKWHVQHGWCYHVWEYDAAGKGKIIGGFYITLLCGDGGVVHFDCYDATISARPQVLRSALLKGLRIVSQHLPLLMATIPSSRESLIQIACRMGFSVVGVYRADGMEKSLLKYLKH